MADRWTGRPAAGSGADDRRARALAVLGLPPGASRTDISRRFRELVKATHPDTSSTATRGDRRAVAPDTSRQMTAICDAYRLLSTTPTADPGGSDDSAEAPTAAARPPDAPSTRTRAPAIVRARRGSCRPPEAGLWLVAGPVRVQPWESPWGPPDQHAEERGAQP